MAAVEVTSLHKSYPRGPHAVRDVSFTAAAGQVTVVLGPNGAGKTTTLAICCGLQRPDAGKVRVLGLDPARRHRALAPRVGVMPQAGGSSASGVYPAARVREVLTAHAAFHASPLPVDGLLARLGLDGVAATAWRHLSGGEQQRLSLALAIVGRPEVVFLDEPTAGLDIAARHLTWDLIRGLCAAGVAVILTTHAMDEAERLADAAIILAAGRVVASGPPATLTRAQEARLSFEAPPGLPVHELDVTTAVVSEPSPGRYVVHGHVTPQLVAAVTAWCADRGVLLDRLSTGARSLEDVVVELTHDHG